jgi:hypothetical protein
MPTKLDHFLIWLKILAIWTGMSALTLLALRWLFNMDLPFTAMNIFKTLVLFIGIVWFQDIVLKITTRTSL